MTDPTVHPSARDPRLAALIAAFERSSYEDRRRYLRRQGYSRFLYKYRGIVPTDPDSVWRLRQILLHSLLWLSSPADFNDPFDMTARVVGEGTLAQRRQRFVELVKQHGQTYSLRKRHAKVEELMRRPLDVIVADAKRAHDEN